MCCGQPQQPAPAATACDLDAGSQQAPAVAATVAATVAAPQQGPAGAGSAAATAAVVAVVAAPVAVAAGVGWQQPPLAVGVAAWVVDWGAFMAGGSIRVG
jgi:hypothetical protein